MSKRNRGDGFKIVTALVCVAIAVLLVTGIFDSGAKYGEAISNYERNSDHYSQNAKREIESRCIPSAAPLDTECVVRVVEASNESQRAERDLVAQTEMSLWAFWMVVVSTAMLGVSMLGVWWIRDTLIETRKAVKSADDAVGVTREIGEAQIRPYLTIRREMNGCPARDRLKDPSSIGLEIANSGVSLARVLEMKTVSFIAPTPLPPFFEIPIHGQRVASSNIISPSLPLEAGAAVAPMSQEMVREVTRSVENKPFAIHVYASVLYRGGSGKRTYRTSYCANLIYHPDGVFVATDAQHNDAT